MTRLHRLIFIVLFLAVILLPTFRGTRAQTQDIVKMYIVNPLTGDNTFNVSTCSVGSTFTMEFYVGNVTDMVTWQIHLTYNRTVINYATAWFPDNNVFKQAIDQGAIPMKGISVNADNATDLGDLLIIMTSTYPPNSLQKYPVSVASKELLCDVNFTITQHSAVSRIEFVSQQQNSSSLRIAPPYYLPDFKTSVDTLNGTYPADGEPAIIEYPAPLPEASVLLLLIWIPPILALILARRPKRYTVHNMLSHGARNRTEIRSRNAAKPRERKSSGILRKIQKPRKPIDPVIVHEAPDVHPARASKGTIASPIATARFYRTIGNGSGTPELVIR